MRPRRSCLPCKLVVQVRIHPHPTLIATDHNTRIDIIELGIPFEEPKTVDPVGKSSNATAYDNGIRIPTMLQIVQSARSQGLNVPVVLMGYYEPIRDYAFGEEKLLRDCKAAGVDGFIIVDFPPDDAARFSESCKAKGLSAIHTQLRDLLN